MLTSTVSRVHGKTKRAYFLKARTHQNCKSTVETNPELVITKRLEGLSGWIHRTNKTFDAAAEKKAIAII